MNLVPIRPKEAEAMLEFMENRFGIPRNAFAGLEFMDNGKGKIFAMNGRNAVFCNRNNIMSASLPFMRFDGAPKPTSMMIQMFGTLATRGIVHLERSKAKDFAAGFDINAKDSECSDGYVIIKYDGFPLGCGLLRNGDIKNQLPKAKRMPVELL